mmetsp:Transcript_18571/g.39755  ORF Transcript_18571/g.39755 Transcript_18571/m.39755 type:complete len:297 (+) Transcript_18571:139-1029(+)
MAVEVPTMDLNDMFESEHSEEVPLGRPRDLDPEAVRLEESLQRHIASLEGGEFDPIATSLRVLREAEQLGISTEQGLSSELDRERYQAEDNPQDLDNNLPNGYSHSSSGSGNNNAGAAAAAAASATEAGAAGAEPVAEARVAAARAVGGVRADSKLDPYERQLEAELEDHLAALRIQERAAAGKLRPAVVALSGEDAIVLHSANGSDAAAVASSSSSRPASAIVSGASAPGPGTTSASGVVVTSPAAPAAASITSLGGHSHNTANEESGAAATPASQSFVPAVRPLSGELEPSEEP